MENREKYPFCKCLRPRKIMNPYTKEWIIVPCGSCVACRVQKDMLSTLKCKLESLSHKYCMFVTLTYAPEYLPYAAVYERTYEDGRTLRYLVNSSERCGGHTDLGEFECTDMALDMLYKKFQSSYIPYLCKRDLQLFMKRLRKRIPYEKIRYYAVGEYGPVHFRPHYHLLLWFDDEQTLKSLGQNIYKSWQFGRVDWQLSRGDSASYVAKYLNSSVNLPQVLRLPQTKPFSLHSTHLGESILYRSKEEVYSSSPSEFTTRGLYLDGTYTEFSVWRSLKTIYFPKCRRYDSLDSNQRLYAYEVYERSSSWCETTRVTEQAKLITDALFDSYHNMAYYRVSNKYQERLLYYFYVTTNFYKTAIRDRKAGAWNSIYQSVYLALSISKHFLFFVCDNLSLEERRRKLSLIENYYKTMDYENLKKQLDSQSYFMEQFDADIDKYYYVHTFDEEEFRKLKPYLNYKMSVLHNSINYVKHKKLNDLNRIFNNI